MAIKNRKALAESIFGERPTGAREQDLCVNSSAYPLGSVGFVSQTRRMKFDQLSRIGDQLSLKRGELLRVRDMMKRGTNHADLATRYHYQDLILRINDALGE